jgi:hypothetical protein
MKFLKSYRILVAAVLFTGMLLGCSQRSTTESPTMPEEIVGVWTTQNKDSAGVSIELRDKSIIISSDLGVAENGVSSVKMEKGGEDGSTLYTISYSDRGRKTNQMEIIYYQEQGGTIRFRSDPSMAWKRSR